MLDMSADTLGWLSTLMVTVVFVAIVAAVSYWLWRWVPRTFSAQAGAAGAGEGT
jgi:hypothetical protein